MLCIYICTCYNPLRLKCKVPCSEMSSSLLIIFLFILVAQLNVDDLSATDVDKLNLCALEFKISAGYFGRLVHLCILIYSHHTQVASRDKLHILKNYVFLISPLDTMQNKADWVIRTYSTKDFINDYCEIMPIY